MIEEIVKTLTHNMMRYKDAIIDQKERLTDYINKTDKHIETLQAHDKLRDEFINEKVEKFLASIPPPKDADNEYILSKLKLDVRDYLIELDEEVKAKTDQSLKDTKETTEQKVQLASDKLESFITKSFEEYQSTHSKTIKLAIETQVNRLPKAKNGKDGKDAKVDYSLINETIKKEIKSKKAVQDISYNKNLNKFEILYTDSSRKEIKINTTNVVMGGGGGTSFNINMLEEITNPTLNDYMVISQNGVMKKVLISNLALLFASQIPADAVTYNGEPIVYNGEYITY